MARRTDFKQYWHDRALELPDGDVLRWVLIDDPIQRGPHAECYRTERRGSLHPTEARRLLDAAGHPDAEHVPVVA